MHETKEMGSNNNNNKRLKENKDYQRNNLHGASMQKKTWITKGTTSMGQACKKKQGSPK
jgi:hypothetical protein